MPNAKRKRNKKSAVRSMTLAAASQAVGTAVGRAVGRVEQMVNRARQRMTGKPAAARRARAGSGRRKAAKRS